MRNVKLLPFIITALSVTFFLFSCDKGRLVSDDGEEQPETVVDMEKVDIEIENSVTLPETRLSLTEEQMRNVSPGNEFSFRLFKTVHDKAESGIVLSPLSVEFVLGMVCNYVDCGEELCQMLGLEGKDIGVVNNYFQTLIGDLTGGDAAGLKLADAVMRDTRGFSFKDELIGTLKNYYNAEYQIFEALPLDKLPVGERPEDLWVKEKTDGMIDSAPWPILPTEASIFNAICFKGEWVHKFLEEATGDHEFVKDDKTVVPVKMMWQTCDSTFIYKGQGFTSISLPMSDGAYLLSILLPDEGKDLNAVLSGLNSESWEELRHGLSYKKVSMGIPKFKAKYSEKELFNLLDENFRKAFSEKNLRMAEIDPETYIVNGIAQKTAFEIDENGAKAAAVTQARMVGSSRPAHEQIEVFVADHPFVYTISETGSGMILFIGTFEG